jgi:uncharacterized caspase-like protein
MGAQVVAVLARHEQPVSSTKTIVALVRRAVFDPRPIALEPGFDQPLVTFPGIDGWRLRTPPQGRQPAGYIMGMIVNTTLHDDDGAETTKRPPIRLKTCTQGAVFERPPEAWPLGCSQTGGAARHRTAPQAREDTVMLPEVFGPLAHGPPTDAHMAGHSRLRQSARLQQAARLQAACFAWTASQMFRSPDHGRLL